MIDNNNPKKLRDGMTVQELENFSKKHRLELAFLVYFVLATFFTFAFWGPAWSIYLCGLGGILGVWLPEKVGSLMRSMFGFIFKQEKITQIVLGVVGIIVSIFLSPLIFLSLGLMGGVGLFGNAKKGPIA